MRHTFAFAPEEPIESYCWALGIHATFWELSVMRLLCGYFGHSPQITVKQCTTGMNMQSGSVLHAILPHSPFPTVKVVYLIVYRPCLTVNNKLFQCGTNVCHILLCQSLVRQNFKICATLPFYACFGHAPLTQWHEECRTRY